MLRAAHAAVVVGLVCAVAASGAAAPAFRFQDNFWVNLHHVLRGDARRRAVGQPLKVPLDALTPAERTAWTAALDGYVEYGRRDLVFDPDLVRISNALADTAGDAPFPDELDARVARLLTRAAPVYRAHRWPTDQRANDAWIAATTALVQAHGYAIASAIEKTYHVEWPTTPFIVDACAEAGPVGGYTTDGPAGSAAHTVIEAANPQLQGEMALETIFHEASHATAIESRLVGAIETAARTAGVTAPKDLWHAVIFYTAGELVRRELGKAGDAHYMPYAYRYGVWERGWQQLRDALARDWQPYLDGHTEYDAALAALLEDSAK